MNVTITVFDATTAAELDAASTFLSDLAGIRSEYDAPKDVPAASAEPVATEAATPARRTRKPRAAAQAPAAEPTVAAEPAAAEPTEVPAATEAPVAEAPIAEPTAADSEWEHTSKTYTEADVQALATLVARAKGPDTVKDKIAELGGARIADLDAAKLNALGAFLEAQNSQK